MYPKRLLEKSLVLTKTDGFKFSFVFTENLVLLSCSFEHFKMQDYDGLWGKKKYIVFSLRRQVEYSHII